MSWHKPPARTLPRHTDHLCCIRPRGRITFNVLESSVAVPHSQSVYITSMKAANEGECRPHYLLPVYTHSYSPVCERHRLRLFRPTTPDMQEAPVFSFSCPAEPSEVAQIAMSHLRHQYHWACSTSPHHQRRTLHLFPDGKDSKRARITILRPRSADGRPKISLFCGLFYAPQIADL